MRLPRIRLTGLALDSPLWIDRCVQCSEVARHENACRRCGRSPERVARHDVADDQGRAEPKQTAVSSVAGQRVSRDGDPSAHRGCVQQLDPVLAGFRHGVRGDGAVVAVEDPDAFAPQVWSPARVDTIVAGDQQLSVSMTTSMFADVRVDAVVARVKRMLSLSVV